MKLRDNHTEKEQKIFKELTEVLFEIEAEEKFLKSVRFWITLGMLIFLVLVYNGYTAFFITFFSVVLFFYTEILFSSNRTLKDKIFDDISYLLYDSEEDERGDD